MEDAEIHQSIFKNAKFRETKLGGAKINLCDLTNAQTEKCQFEKEDGTKLTVTLCQVDEGSVFSENS